MIGMNIGQNNALFNVTYEVQQERYRQFRKWGEQNHRSGTWLKILMEEVGEYSKANLEGDLIGQRDELVQVAAVAHAMVEWFDRESDRPRDRQPPCDCDSCST
jgi:hypothetical protein